MLKFNSNKNKKRDVSTNTYHLPHHDVELIAIYVSIILMVLLQSFEFEQSADHLSIT